MHVSAFTCKNRAPSMEEFYFNFTHISMRVHKMLAKERRNSYNYARVSNNGAWIN